MWILFDLLKGIEEKELVAGWQKAKLKLSLQWGELIDWTTYPSLR